MNLYTAVQKSTGLRESRNVYVRLIETTTMEVHDAIIGSAVFIESIMVTDEELVHIYRVKFETPVGIVSTVITFGMNGVMPMTHNIRDEDSPTKSYIVFI